MENNKKKIAYVVLSCDPYSDIWDTYGIMFQRFWSDCPYDTYLASHNKVFDKYGFKPILIGEDISWSDGLLTVLNKLQSQGYEYAMVAFDDFLLSKKIDTKYVVGAIDRFIAEKGQCLRFDPLRTSRCQKHNEFYGSLYIKAPYRVTLGFTLWEINTLKEITISGESAWQFEKNATERSFHYDAFYCTWRRPFHFINLINKRKLDIAEYWRLKCYLPDAHYDRKKSFVVKEKVKGWILYAFLRFYPVKRQYALHQKLTKPIDL